MNRSRKQWVRKHRERERWTREAGVRNLERAIAGEVQYCTVG